jgi:hypothetical protein
MVKFAITGQIRQNGGLIKQQPCKTGISRLQADFTFGSRSASRPIAGRNAQS